MEQFELAYNTALKFLSYRQRSTKEVRDNLLKKKIEQKIIDQVINKLKEQKFLNDEEFARMWIESRNRFKPRSQRLLKLELRRKGIHDEIIESTLPAGRQGITNQESGETDVSSAKKIVEKRIGKVKHLPRQEIYQKLGGLLARRGFDWETIKRAIDDILGKEYNNYE